MAISWRAQVALLLSATAGFGVMAVVAAPDGGTGIGMWPAGGAAAALLLTPRHRVSHVSALLVLVAAGSIVVGGRPPEVAVGFGVGIAAEAWLVRQVFGGGRSGRPALRVHADLTRFLTAAGVGALVVGAAVLGTCAVSGFGDPLLTALTVSSAQLCSMLTVLPFFARLRTHETPTPTPERVLQWLMILVVTPAVFWLHDLPGLAFLVIPVLAWGALRASPYEALAQTYAVFAIAMNLTTFGWGPFTDVPIAYDLPVDVRPILLALFGIACVLVVLPMMLIVGEQRHDASEAAAERDKVQRIVNGATGVAIIGTDGSGRITLFNPGAQRLLGYAPEEVMGLPTTILHTQEAVAEKAAELGVRPVFREVALALTAPDRAGTDMLFLRKDGVQRHHSMTLNRLVDDRAKVTGYVSTSEDVTERVEAQAALVEALAVERTAVERLREVDRVKDTFVGSVSHELRTPITSIVGYLEMLGEGEFGELNPAQADAVRRVSANSSRLLLLIDDLLTLSRVEDDELVLTDRALDLRALVRAGYDVVAPSWEARDLKVRLELPEEPLPFLGDRDMIERVVVNLVGNAAKYTPDGGQVEVLLRGEAHEAVLEVRDSGIGIPAGEQHRIFTRFFRSSSAQRQAIPGSGLGLSIARAVVEKHGGSVGLESAEDEGTTFRVRLPLVV